jgi:hypothetical protein
MLSYLNEYDLRFGNIINQKLKLPDVASELDTEAYHSEWRFSDRILIDCYRIFWKSVRPI